MDLEKRANYINEIVKRFTEPVELPYKRESDKKVERE